MKATWFDEERGARSGRVERAGAPEGARVFVLGAADPPRVSIVGPDDFTEVRQIVDLTGYDLVGATMDTIGRALLPIQPPSGWPLDDGALLRWNLDNPLGPVPSVVPDRFPLLPEGDILPDTETYSPEQSYCRRIPVGSAAARLAGVMSALPSLATMDRWTLQWWQDWVGWPTVPTSWGVDLPVFSALSALHGLRVRWRGLAGPGAHRWYLMAATRDGSGGMSDTAFVNYLLDPPLGWTQFTVVYDRFAPFPLGFRLYADAVLVDTGFAGPAAPLAMPPAGTAVEYGGPQLQSRFDQIRLLPDIALSDADVADSFAQCTTLPPPIALAWRMELLIDGERFAAREIPPAEQRRWADFLAPCRQLVGPHEVAFRLTLARA